MNTSTTGIQRVRALADISRSGYVVIATKPAHRLQIRPIVHSYSESPTIPPCYIRVRVVIWECGEGQTNRHTDARDHYTVHFASSNTHAKCDHRSIKLMTAVCHEKWRNAWFVSILTPSFHHLLLRSYLYH